MNGRRALWLVLLIPAVALPLAAGTPEVKRWKTAALDFALSSKDFQATRHGKPVFSARQRLAGQIVKFRQQVALSIANLSKQEGRDLSWDIPVVEYSAAIEPVSSVGSVISLHESGYSMCPGCTRERRWDRVIAIDLSPRPSRKKDKPGAPRAASLIELWSERQVLDALLADRLLKEFVTPEATPANLAAFWKLFRLPRASGGDPNCDYDVSVGPQLLQAFAFNRLERGKVVVQVWLPPRSAACRGQTKQISLVLPIPERLREALDGSNRLQSGFLMEDVKNLGNPSYLVSADAAGLVPPEWKSKAVAPRRKFKVVEGPDGGPISTSGGGRRTAPP